MSGISCAMGTFSSLDRLHRTVGAPLLMDFNDFSMVIFAISMVKLSLCGYTIWVRSILFGHFNVI